MIGFNLPIVMKADSKNRLYELDWLRTAAIVLVVWFHAGMFFNSWGWHIKSDIVVRGLEPIMVWMHYWRMPLLLFISGIGTSFMLRRCSLVRFVWERHNRLMIPLVFGMFVIVPPQIYVERIDSFASYFEFYQSVFIMEPYPEGNFSWHHLWFIAYLFCFSLCGLPIFAFFRSEKSSRIKQHLGRILSKKGLLSLGVVPIMLTEVLLRKHFPVDTHALVGDGAAFTKYFLFFISGYIAMILPGVWDSIRRDRWIYTMLACVSTFLLELGILGKLPEYHVNGFGIVWGSLTVFTGWFTILVLVGWSQVFLRRKSERLARWNEASYPVYILHQTLIVLAAYPMTHWDLAWPIQFAILFAVGLLGSFLLYQIVIKRFAGLRLVFGLKSRRVARTHKQKTGNEVAKAGIGLVESQS